MTSSERRRLRDIAKDCPAAAREALLSLAGPRRTVKAAKKERLVNAEASRIRRVSRRGAVREAAMFRDGERCVLCPAIDLRWSPLEMHHVIGRHDERIETVAMLCARHHNTGPDSMHAGNLKTMRRLAEWALGKGYAEAARHLARRIAKAEDVRAPRAAGGA